MNNNEIFSLITNETTKIIEETFSEKEIELKFKEQLIISHFLPIRHRVLGGLYQSINIKFGNFLENLLKKLINDSKEYKVVSSININHKIFTNKNLKNFEENRFINGGKQTCFIISNRNQILIDNYVNECIKVGAEKSKIEENFKNLLAEIQNNIKEEKENPKIYDFSIFKNDVDLLFFKTCNNDYYYVELKKEDNHDSGKTKDMYKKVIKTFTCLLYEDYSDNDNRLMINSLTPILLFFGDIKNPSNILPKENVFSGSLFFDNYLNISFNMINENMCEVSNSKKINDILLDKNKYILNFSNQKLLDLLDIIIENEIKDNLKIELKKIRCFKEILFDFDLKIKSHSKKITKKLLNNLEMIESEDLIKDLIIKHWDDYISFPTNKNLEKVIEDIKKIKKNKEKFEKEVNLEKQIQKELLEKKYNKKIIEKYNQ